MPLPTAELGTTGMHVTRVGFGAWAVGGGDWAFAWGPQEDDESLAAIRRAVDLGVNWIDTAAVYGLGHSEEVVAKALRDFPEPDRPLVFTKCGLVWEEDDRRAQPRRVGRPESIRREVDASLRRLGVERIDLYQMHWPAEDGTPVEEYWGVLLELKAAGKIRAAGLSNHGEDLLERADAIGHVDSLQPPMSAIHREVARRVLPWCEEHRTAVIAYSPMQSGLLTGAFDSERVARLPEDDWRRRDPDFSGETLDANLSVAAELGRIGARYGTGAAAVAVAWVLAWPGVTGAIVGARTASQVDGWAPAAGLTLSREDLARVAAAIENAGAGEGPTLPPAG